MSVSSTRACVSCRVLKIRCIIDETSVEKKCQRCARTDRICTFPPQQRRKQRKRTDARVADLEDKIESLKNLVEGETADDHSNARIPGRTISNENQSENTVGIVSRESGQDIRSNGYGNGLLSLTMASSLYETYNADLITHFPAVIFPPNTTVEGLARQRPTLFLAIMAAAARKSHPDLASLLTAQMLQSYAMRAFLQSEKSLELVQAMTVTAVWYCPPEGSGQGKHNFYEYIHMAATMALDIVPSDSSTLFAQRLTNIDSGGDEEYQPEWHACEFDRALLSCYVTCCGVAQSLRRPTLLRHGHQVRKCAGRLSGHHLATIHDHRLVAWVELFRIVEMFARDLSYEELNNVAKIDDPQTHALLREYESQLAQWRSSVDMSIFGGLLELTYHHMNIYLHEIAFHGDRDPEDFKPPFTFKRLYRRSSPSSVRIDVVLRCVSSVQALVEAFLHMNEDLLRSLPLFGFIRLAYGIIILEMIDAPYEYGLTRESLQIEHYTSLVIGHLRRVVGLSQCRVPSFFLNMMLKLRAWHRQGSQASDPDTIEGVSQRSSDSPATGVSPLTPDNMSVAGEVHYAGIYNGDGGDIEYLPPPASISLSKVAENQVPSSTTRSAEISTAQSMIDANGQAQEDFEALDSPDLNISMEDVMLLDDSWLNDLNLEPTDLLEIGKISNLDRQMPPSI